MRFPKHKPDQKEYPCPGAETALDGNTAVYVVENLASEAIIIHERPEFAGITAPLTDLALDPATRGDRHKVLVRQTDQPASALLMANGYALTGMRSTVLAGSLRSGQDILSALAGARLTCVINLAARAATRHAGALGASHDEYYGLAAAGLFQMYAADVQETADFTLIAHRIAELSLTPGIVAQDLYQTSHSVQNVRMPDAGFIRNFLGGPGDVIDTPTASQTLLFGDTRRRIPLMLDPDHPAGTGGVQDEDSYFKALAAQRPFFYSHLDTITDATLHEFGDLTGRYYERVSGYRHEDAEVLVVAQGAITQQLQEVVDYLRNKDRLKAGVINIRMLRPFPGASVAQLLKGKKAVTVLERTDEPLAEDPPLAREIRSATARAVENGRVEDDIPHPAYPRYKHRRDCPRIHTGSYGVGTGLPTAAELIAVYRNMLAADERKSFFYIGTNFRRPDRRFPHLQTRQQILDQHYPSLHQQILAGTGESPPTPNTTRALQIHSLSLQGGLVAGNIFARNLAHTLGRQIRTFPAGGLEPCLQPASLTVVIGDASPKGEPETLDAVLVTAYKLLDNPPLITRIRKQGTLIIESNKPPENTWRGLSRLIQEAIRARRLHLYTIDAETIAADTASNPSFVDQLAVWALLGAYLKCNTATPGMDQPVFIAHLETQLEKIFGANHVLTNDILAVIKRAAERVSELPWQLFKAEEHTAIVEPEVPWNVAQAGKGTEDVFDVSRFWQSVGYLYDTGQSGHTLVDPYVATGIMPARSSAFRDISPYRLRIPRWLPENCTGCGLCWALCPESALPPTIQSLSSIIRTMVTRCEQEGMLMTQMNRVGDPLAKQAHRMLAADDLRQYLTVGALLRNTLVQLMERLKIEGDTRDDLLREFEAVCKPVEEFKFARTAIFFTEPESAEKGTGVLLNISLNPMSCTGCGSCVENCPEDAFAWSEQTVGMLDEYRHHWQLQRQLPRPDSHLVSRFIATGRPESNLNRLLMGDAYHSLVGGDGAIPGNSLKTSVHQLTATLESIMYLRFERHCGYLDGLITGLEQKIQGKVTGAMRINDFEGFTRRLARLKDATVSAQELAALVGEDGTPRSVDPGQLTRVSHLLEALKELRKRYSEGMEGKGRARMVLAIDPGAASFWNGAYPYNPHSQPWICHLPGAAPFLAEGIFEGITQNLAREIKLYRQAELELSDDYDAVEFEKAYKGFGWRLFTSEEQELIPPVLVLCRAESTGGATLARLLSGRYPVKVVMLSNEGIVISGSGTDPGSNQQFQSLALWEKEADLLTLMHTGTFVLQTTAANPEHLMDGITEAMKHSGPVLLHIYAPHPQASEIAPDMVIRQAALASESRVFPLFRIKPGIDGATLTIDSNPAPDRDWAMRELPFVEPSTARSSITVPYTVAHWAIRESRFQEHFRILPMGHVSDKLKPLVDYIGLAPEQRQAVDPYIDFTDARQRRYIAVVSEAMVKATEDARELWRYLQKLAHAPPVDILDQKTPPQAQTPQAGASAPQPDMSAYQRLTDRLLSLCGYSQDPEFFRQSLREFITQGDETTRDA
jgi:pyruvate-ferredoxin/flavodoxin oxidoreductase